MRLKFILIQCIYVTLVHRLYISRAGYCNTNIPKPFKNYVLLTGVQTYKIKIPSLTICICYGLVGWPLMLDPVDCQTINRKFQRANDIKVRM